MNQATLNFDTKPYYNTNKLNTEQLQEANKKAVRQEQVLRVAFYHYRELTPSEAFKIVQGWGFDWPLTSVRRAITNLKNQKFVVKTNVMKMGMYGKQEHEYEIW